VRTLFQSLLLGLLVSALIQTPVMAAPASVSAPIGVVVQSDRAFLGGEGAASGASIFDGDALNTGGAGSVSLRFGPSQAYLPAESSAIFHQFSRNLGSRLAPGIGADLTRGTIVLSAPEGDTFRLVADGAQIRPATSQLTIAQVTKVSDNELIINSRKGVLEVLAESEIKSIPEGTSYRMILQPDPAPASQVTAPGGRNRIVWVLITGAVVGTTVAVVLALLSPCKP
jgi:hypothetical protein